MANTPKGLAHPTLVDVVRKVEKTMTELTAGNAENSAPPEFSRRSSTGSTWSDSTKGSVEADHTASGKHNCPSSPPTSSFSFCHGRLDLSSMDAKSLRHRLDPVFKALEKVDAEGVLDLERTRGTGARLCQGVKIKPIHGLIIPQKTYDRGTCVRYLHITETEGKYSMGIFIFPPNATIPLHDHPGMSVLSRLLYGDVDVKSFDLIEEEEYKAEEEQREASLADSEHKSSFSWVQDAFSVSRAIAEPAEDYSHRRKLLNRSGSWLSGLLFPGKQGCPPKKKIPEGSLRANQNKIQRVSAPCVLTLFPFKGNAHEFTAGPNGAAILDVLLPPYDYDQNRDCTFYRSEFAPGSGGHGLSCWLVPISQPEDFHCISGKYIDFGRDEEG